MEDGRAFLERSDRRYDLILFALPDSLVLVAGQGSLRLESFLFTREAFEAVRSHLGSEGTFSMYNYYRPDVFARYAATLTEVFGSRPCLDVGEQGAGANRQAVLTISAQPEVLRCSTFWVPPRDVPRPATDNYPFPYAQGWGLSTFYVVSLASLLLGTALAIRRFGHVEVADARRYLDLFFMGAAFLLLETKSVVQFALLFGTTWLVNALVFAGILLSVLLAIEIAERVRRLRPRLLYTALLASLGVAWAVGPEQLLGLSPVTRFVAATTITFAPIFFGNLIFAERFRSVSSSTTAFGINLLGAILGGVLAGLAWASRRVTEFREKVAHGFAILGDRRAFLTEVVSWQAASWLARAFCIYFFLRAFHIHAGVEVVVAVLVVQGISTVLPFTPGGAGTQQAVLVFALRGTASGSAVLAFSVGMQLVTVAVNVVLAFAAIAIMLRTLRVRRHLFAAREELATAESAAPQSGSALRDRKASG